MTLALITAFALLGEAYPRVQSVGRRLPQHLAVYATHDHKSAAKMAARGMAWQRNEASWYAKRCAIGRTAWQDPLKVALGDNSTAEALLARPGG